MHKFLFSSHARKQVTILFLKFQNDSTILVYIFAVFKEIQGESTAKRNWNCWKAVDREAGSRAKKTTDARIIHRPKTWKGKGSLQRFFIDRNNYIIKLFIDNIVSMYYSLITLWACIIHW